MEKLETDAVRNLQATLGNHKVRLLHESGDREGVWAPISRVFAPRDFVASICGHSTCAWPCRWGSMEDVYAERRQDQWDDSSIISWSGHETNTG